MGEQTYAISLEHINKSFGGVPVLKDVFFQLERGTVHALVGGNGAGKSTLMKIMSGVYTCDSGTIKVNGQEVKITNTADAEAHGIKMIFQELSLSPTLTVMENIFLAHELKKGIALDKREMTARTQQLLDELHISAKPSDKIKDLDVGICQLVEIAKALSFDAKVLVMDEPTASLSDKETKTLFHIIEQLKEKGVSIVYISHRMHEIFQVAERITVLKDGQVVAEKEKSEFSLDGIIEAMIGGNTSKKMEYVPRTVPIQEDVLFSVQHLSVGDRVKDVSFQVRQGEVLGIAGLMGSGRTETLEALFGLRATSPETQFFLRGKPVKIRSVNDAMDLGLALIPEDRRRQGLILQHSVKDNLCLPNLKKLVQGLSISGRKVANMTSACVQSLSIKTDGINISTLSLSGGNQQKVVIAKWLERSPNLLLMDEPTAGVDIVAKAEIIDIIRKYVSQGSSVIFVSSELSEMMAICDRILVYHFGTISHTFDRENLISEEILEHAIQE